MAQLDVVRSALRNAVRACIVTAANQAALLNDYPHGGTELGEIAFVDLGVQDELHVPRGWEFGAPVDHGYRSGQTWVLALKVRALQDPDWRALGWRGVATTDGYAPAAGTIKADPPGFVAAGGMILLSPPDLTHEAVICYAPVREIARTPIRWSSAAPAVGSLLFTLGRHFTIGESVAVDRLEHLRLS